MIFLQFFLDKGQWKMCSNQLLRPGLDKFSHHIYHSARLAKIAVNFTNNKLSHQ